MKQLTKPELNRVLTALDRHGDSVYHARKVGKKVYVQFVGDHEETVMTMPKAKRAKRTDTSPVKSRPAVVVTSESPAPATRATTKKK